MKKYVVLIVGCLLPLVVLAAVPAANNLPTPLKSSGTASAAGDQKALGPLNPIEQKPEMAAIRAELKQAQASGDHAWIKRVERRIQALYLAHQAPQKSTAVLTPARDPSQGMAPLGPYPDVEIAGPVVLATAADYTTDGSMYAAALLPDSDIDVWKSRDHGATWSVLNGIHSPAGWLPRIQLVVTQADLALGDSGFVNLFGISPISGPGDVYVARFDTAGNGWTYFPVLTGDTINDIAFTQDNDTVEPWLYGVAYNKNRTDDNCAVLRSEDWGKTFAVTNTFSFMSQAEYEGGAGTWQYLVGAYNENPGTLIVLINHNFGDPAYWFEPDYGVDTFEVEVPTLAPEFTLPETDAVAWLAYGHGDGSGHINLTTTYTTDGFASWAAPQNIPIENGAYARYPDMKSYHVVGNSYMDIIYVSYYNGYWRLFRRFTDASNPGTWSDTLRIGADNAVQMWGWQPVEVYSPGVSGSGAGAVYTQWDTATHEVSWMVWNAPWNTTGIGGGPRASPVASTLGIAPNPAGQAVRLGWSGVASAVAVYDLSGKLVCRFDRPAGSGLVWNRTDGLGRAVSAGVYVVRLETSLGITARTLVLK